MAILEYIIVGAGPAGLAARYGLHLLNKSNYLLIDSGNDLSERLNFDKKVPMEGVGGAALFSDGYLMFYPADNRIRSLNRDLLKVSYRQLMNMFESFLTMPPFPLDAELLPVTCEKDSTSTEKRKQEKQSVSHFTLDQRMAFFTSISQNIPPSQLSMNTKLYQIERMANGNYILHCKRDDNEIDFHCKNIILAGGRFFPILSHSSDIIEHTFKQVEVGVRFCGPAMSDLFSV